jgi:hypothetical protein
MESYYAWEVTVFSQNNSDTLLHPNTVAELVYIAITFYNTNLCKKWINIGTYLYGET